MYETHISTWEIFIKHENWWKVGRLFTYSCCHFESSIHLWIQELMNSLSCDFESSRWIMYDLKIKRFYHDTQQWCSIVEVASGWHVL
jgi:hypothetical protein